MNVLLYGRSADAWVTPIIQAVQAAADLRGKEIAALPIETAVRSLHEWQSVERLYVLPFDLPERMPDTLPTATPRLLAALFPRAELINAPATHELCWDKLATAQRLLERGIPMPETLITADPAEAEAFVRQHQQAILKEPRAAGGHGHVVLLAGDDGALAGEIPGRRYAVELQASGVGRVVRHGILSIPPPFYLQRLVTSVGRGGVLRPAQVLRAYIVGGQVAFWTERYRDKIRRPGDFIVSVTFGARYRFLRAVGDSLAGLARRTAEALGVRVGAIDLLRAGDDGPFVLEADTDGQHLVIDRSFKALPEYRDVFDFDRMIADALLTPLPEIRAGALRHDAEPRAPRPRVTRDSATAGVVHTRGRVVSTRSDRPRSDRVRRDRPRDDRRRFDRTPADQRRTDARSGAGEARTTRSPRDARAPRGNQPDARATRSRGSATSWSAGPKRTPRGGEGSARRAPAGDAFVPRQARPADSRFAGPRSDAARFDRPRGAAGDARRAPAGGAFAPRQPRPAGARFAGPRSDAARFNGPRGGASTGRARADGPRSGGPRSGGPGPSGPRTGGPRSGGPGSSGPRSGSPRSGPAGRPRRGGPPGRSR
jgi:hypothetical protein